MCPLKVFALQSMFYKNYLLIYLFNGSLKLEIFQPQIHSPDGCKGQCCDRPKLLVSSTSPTWVAGIQTLGPSYVAFPGPVSEVEHPEREWSPIWFASVTGGSFICYAITLVCTPHFLTTQRTNCYMLTLNSSLPPASQDITFLKL